MIKKKICMIGAFAVGKTSLVQRYVNSIFSEKYLTTIGVKIDQKMLQVNNQDVNLLVWDIHGEDDFQKIKPSYLMGAGAYFLIVDPTRKNTLSVAKELQKLASTVTKDSPFIVLFNKSDLKDLWEIEENEISNLKDNNWMVIETSAKTGEGVEEAFIELTKKILA